MQYLFVFLRKLSYITSEVQKTEAGVIICIEIVVLRPTEHIHQVVPSY